MYGNKKQSGFTLVEIAIVLVIIGLLLGGILKGQELINSARVRNMADQNSGIQAAYFGFIDRYRQVPGDWAAAAAAQAIGDATVTLGGNGNGRIDNTLAEAAGVFSQLSKSNFLGGGFTPATAAPGTEALYVSTIASPVNAFNGALVLTRNDGYSGTNSVRLNLHMGVNVPVSIARELDIKVDDGLPNTGVLRLTILSTVNTFPANFVTQVAGCTAATGANAPGFAVGTNLATDVFDIFDDFQDCGQVFVY
ncbi:MAG: prepilin-type N-terminal cleavage/methylation domain-containing protein [Proteobacteria bacterium]|nr:prepilin-type N-terminal cleavage/methylation domain-containing protein [Pseudomonadota bacterium]